jgi:dolichyl-phosphate beta-glucosyltransferase
MLRSRLTDIQRPPHSSRPPIARPFAPTDHELTVLIPAYNEQDRLGPTLAQLERFLDNTTIDYRILVIDDGSQDETAKFTDDRGCRLSTLRLSAHRGKGAAVRAGMLAATGAVVAFTDADLPYDLQSLVRGYEYIRSGRCEIVFGARDLGDVVAQASRRLSRRVSSKLFRYFVSSLISRDVTDTQCGLKLFAREAAVNIFLQTTVDGFAFDAEVVYLTNQLNISYCCIPVSLINEDSSTLSLSRHALPMVRDVLKVRYSRWKSIAKIVVHDLPTESTFTSRRAA